MEEQTDKFEMNALELIQLKDIKLTQRTKAYYDLNEKERELKKEETRLLLETDFKGLGLTNEKQRTSYVNEATASLKTLIDEIRFAVKQDENDLEIINDLIKLRLMEVKTE